MLLAGPVRYLRKRGLEERVDSRGQHGGGSRRRCHSIRVPAREIDRMVSLLAERERPAEKLKSIHTVHRGTRRWQAEMDHVFQGFRRSTRKLPNQSADCLEGSATRSVDLSKRIKEAREAGDPPLPLSEVTKTQVQQRT